jgi:sugar phosphate isomerase/epimerase
MNQKTISRVLWTSVVRRYPIREQIVAAAGAGFDTLSVAADVYLPERERGVTAKELQTIAEDHGVVLDFLDGFCGWAPRQFSSEHGPLVRQVMGLSTEECLDICAELGLKTIVTMPWFEPGAVGVTQLVECFAPFCERAAKFAIQVDLEFTPIWGIADLRTAWDIVRGANCPNSSIMLDTWNFAKGNADMRVLAEIPPERIANIQATDGFIQARAPDMISDSLHHRAMPGEGEFDIDAMLRIRMEKGGVRSIGPEVFYLTENAPTPSEGARRAADSSEGAMERAGYPLGPRSY